MDSGCGSVGRAVASNSRCLLFKPSQLLNIEKSKIEKMMPGIAYFDKGQRSICEFVTKTAERKGYSDTKYHKDQWSRTI